MAGYKIWEMPQSLVLHYSRPRTAWLFYYQIRNRWHFSRFCVRTSGTAWPACTTFESLT